MSSSWSGNNINANRSCSRARSVNQSRVRFAAIAALFLCLSFPAEAAAATAYSKVGMTVDGMICVDAATGTVLSQKLADFPADPASVTKLMTFLLVLEDIRLRQMGDDGERDFRRAFPATLAGQRRIPLETAGGNRQRNTILAKIVRTDAITRQRRGAGLCAYLNTRRIDRRRWRDNGICERSRRLLDDKLRRIRSWHGR